MKEIICPQCGHIIKIGKDEYNTLLNEIEKSEIDNRVQERVNEIKNSFEAQYQLKLNEVKTAKNTEISNLQKEKAVLEEQLKNTNKDTELAVAKATEDLKKNIAKEKEENVRLNGNIEVLRNNSALEIKNLKEGYEFQLKEKDEQIQRWKDFQVGNSTKALGESLEQYCYDVFAERRAVAYPNAYFEKDNEVDENGKGDFIFRDFQDGIETVSILFEMKNQNDKTKTKHKNEDFLAKLDKNRLTKKCEYAVLVSTLEEDSKLYNKGIVNVSYKYPKMYIIRPQFFLTFIDIISDIAKKSFEYKKQVINYQRENIDITSFETTVQEIISKIGSDYEKANKYYNEVDKMCDDIVNKVENFRKSFKTAAGWIEKAKKQLSNLEIKKLTYGNPTMKEKFDALKDESDK